jgi:hypothetical protein
MLIRPLFRRNKKSPKVVVNISSGDEAEVVEVEEVEEVKEAEEPGSDWEAEVDAAFGDDDEEA